MIPPNSFSKFSVEESTTFAVLEIAFFSRILRSNKKDGKIHLRKNETSPAVRS
ncbi:hypothetical protein LEP1GSC127_0503 [Leptospira kirschneri str. 200801925]|uniref:Uncharacterized protein n=1 Tax=Leptospira kirschneri str. 200802841 TaxID=1193047 RepID=A0A828Y9V3_9LEPT|nr:hypothetical protein LEP1GSC044_0555 [Leptospira kirschneri serovar Grippotyphosa str. RM52]EKO53724.1 hypothetical protein LEP1GSC131_3065 [Leptospira kirschneri str. 200802841]EKQ85462.1 hypothetical protein LEP1GSC064_0681 [Leptospira kirschneri serovar Grippotyphosa str. Moskva]EKR09436.1 hypothetical protein LEP1GSC122_0289 [Leptospira kirschneri serovar Valbuzzi str. 200702274]EMK06369.1 hypothetical protein LEP1GSC176_3684 [Leptospira kirschneri str. MMD1493]EMK14153.1 hypothetical p